MSDAFTSGSSSNLTGKHVSPSDPEVDLSRGRETVGMGVIYNPPSSLSSSSNDDNGNREGDREEEEEGLPPQLHAGKVGYGPNYHSGPDIGDKIAGVSRVFLSLCWAGAGAGAGASMLGVL